MSKRDDAIARYEAIIAKFPDVERKGKANPYTSRNGNMFSFVGKDGGVALRLSAEQREQFLMKHNAALAVAYATVMKEYVAVPEHVLRNMRLMTKYFASSITYVSSLQAKPTTRKPTAKKSAAKKPAAKKAAKK